MRPGQKGDMFMYIPITQGSKLSMSKRIYERGSIVVRAHASHVEGLRFEPDWMPLLNARSLFTQQQMGIQWEQWGDKGGGKGTGHPT